MATAQRRWAVELLHFWFEKLGDHQRFGSGIDAECSLRFGRDLEMLSTRSPHSFLTDPQTALAAVILFDQIPRNVHRGTPKAFAYDALARFICQAALLRGWDKGMTFRQRQFLAVPLMHSENITDHYWSLRLFTQMPARYGLAFAKDHYRMIARFGRYPHRNAVLDRESTEAEKHAVASGFAW